MLFFQRPRHGVGREYAKNTRMKEGQYSGVLTPLLKAVSEITEVASIEYSYSWTSYNPTLAYTARRMSSPLTWDADGCPGWYFL